MLPNLGCGQAHVLALTRVRSLASLPSQASALALRLTVELSVARVLAAVVMWVWPAGVGVGEDGSGEAVLAGWWW